MLKTHLTEYENELKLVYGCYQQDGEVLVV